MDAACLAVTGMLYSKGKSESIPENPDVDEMGIVMKLTVPMKGIDSVEKRRLQ